MAIERILEEIKKLSPIERYKLRIMLEVVEITDDDIEVSKQTAGRWADIDADSLIEDLYRSRRHNPGRAEVDW